MVAATEVGLDPAAVRRAAAIIPSPKGGLSSVVLGAPDRRQIQAFLEDAPLPEGRTELVRASERLLGRRGEVLEDDSERFVWRENHGIGRTTAREICDKAELPAVSNTDALADAEVVKLREIIERDYKVEGDRRRETSQNIKMLMDIGCYRGLRHRRGLPVRGQRTRTNARTRKGPKKTVAGKKGVKDLR